MRRKADKAIKSQGGNEKDSSSAICDVFSSSSLLISSKKFQVEASLGSQSPFAFPCSFFLFSLQSPAFLGGFQISLPPSTVLLGTPRELPLAVHPFFSPSFCFISFRLPFTTTSFILGASLTAPNWLPGSLFIPLLTVGRFHSEVLSGDPRHNLRRDEDV